MAERLTRLDDLTRRVATLPPVAPRLLVAVAGPPAAGKSTLAAALVQVLNQGGECAVMVPMDGFHLDNAELDAKGLRSRKGAPDTFDTAGFLAAMRRLAEKERMKLPAFDRTADRTIPDRIEVAPEHRIAVVEGNYLLCKDLPWSELQPLWALSILADAPMKVLRTRLIARWLDHGMALAPARARAERNDIPNAAFVLETACDPDIRFATDSAA